MAIYDYIEVCVCPCVVHISTSFQMWLGVHLITDNKFQYSFQRNNRMLHKHQFSFFFFFLLRLRHLHTYVDALVNRKIKRMIQFLLAHFAVLFAHIVQAQYCATTNTRCTLRIRANGDVGASPRRAESGNQTARVVEPPYTPCQRQLQAIRSS